MNTDKNIIVDKHGATLNEHVEWVRNSIDFLAKSGIHNYLEFDKIKRSYKIHTRVLYAICAIQGIIMVIFL